jgi:hypothetical protein
MQCRRAVRRIYTPKYPRTTDDGPYCSDTLEYSQRSTTSGCSCRSKTGSGSCCAGPGIVPVALVPVAVPKAPIPVETPVAIIAMVVPATIGIKPILSLLAPTPIATAPLPRKPVVAPIPVIEHIASTQILLPFAHHPTRARGHHGFHRGGRYWRFVTEPHRNAVDATPASVTNRYARQSPTPSSIRGPRQDPPGEKPNGCCHLHGRRKHSDTTYSVPAHGGCFRSGSMAGSYRAACLPSHGRCGSL